MLLVFATLLTTSEITCEIQVGDGKKQWMSKSTTKVNGQEFVFINEKPKLQFKYKSPRPLMFSRVHTISRPTGGKWRFYGSTIDSNGIFGTIQAQWGANPDKALHNFLFYDKLIKNNHNFKKISSVIGHVIDGSKDIIAAGDGHCFSNMWQGDLFHPIGTLTPKPTSKVKIVLGEYEATFTWQTNGKEYSKVLRT